MFALFLFVHCQEYYAKYSHVSLTCCKDILYIYGNSVPMTISTELKNYNFLFRQA